MKPKNMKPKNIKGGNNIIVNFMDNNLHFKSWNGIMQVVEKLEKECKTNVCIFKNTCHIEYYGIHNEPFDVEVTSNNKITAVWSAVIEYLKWYTNDLTINKK